jgi:3alpha(or 20beta)-hydroxysteroid dehydrogenase
MTKVLEGRAALITGSGNGIGRATALRMASMGATIGVNDLKAEFVEKVVGEIEAAGGKAVAVTQNVATRDGMRNAVLGFAKSQGRFDILVNNAAWVRYQAVPDIAPETMDRMLDIGFKGVIWGIQAAAEVMDPEHGGAIVNIASVAATIAFPGIAGYSATKSAVDRLTRVAAFEAGKLGFGVRVNCVYPGLVPTEMGQQLAADVTELGLFASPEAAVGAVIEQTPAGRLGEVSDMADAVVFLASDQARFITGAGLPVDGGMGM